MHAAERRGRRQRPAQVDALRGGEQLDRDDRRGVARHRRQARAPRTVAMLTWSSWFAEVGSESTLTRVRERLVLGRERRGGDLRDHEARVDAAVLDQERRQARQVRVDQQRDAPLGERADLGDREREVVGGEGHRLGVEVAAREHVARCRRTRAGCRTRRWLRSAARRGVRAAGRGTRPSPAAGSAGSTGPARGGSRRARRGSRCRRAARGRSPRRRVCPRCPRSAWMRASNGVSLPRHASTRQRAGDERRREHVLGGEQPGERERGRHLRAVDQREPLLGRERERRAGRRARERLARRHRRGRRRAPRLRRSARRRDARAARGRPTRRPSLAPECTAARRHWRARRAPRRLSSARRNGRARAMPP